MPVSAVRILLVMLSVGGGSMRMAPSRGGAIFVDGAFGRWAGFVCHG